jgi:type IV pilus biogenesis protein CpaD/CtpE
MKALILPLLGAAMLAACASPTAEQAARETRHDPVRADYMLALNFAPGTSRLDTGQVNDLRAMVAVGRSAQRDEFIVVSSATGGPMQSLRAQQVQASLSAAGARWVSTSFEPAMAIGPDQVVVVRSDYRIAELNCPNYNPSSIGNPNGASMPGFGCGDAYNFGQMLARPRDAAIGRTPGPAEAWTNAAAIQRYREGRVRTATPSGGGGGASGVLGGGEGGSGVLGGGGIGPGSGSGATSSATY